MKYTSLIYLNGRCPALQIEGQGMKALYYTAEDEVLDTIEGKFLDLSDFCRDYKFYENSWYGRNNTETKREYEASQKLTASVQFVPEETDDDCLVLKVVDPEYRSVLEKHKKKAQDDARKAEAAAKRALANEKRAATLAAKKSGAAKKQSEKTTDSLPKFTPVETPDPDDPKNWEIRVKIHEKKELFQKSCACGKSNCRHTMAVADFFEEQKRQLKEAYIHSKKAMDKSYFLSEKLEKYIDDCGKGAMDMVSPERVTLLHKTVEEIVSIQSPSYCDAVLDYLFSFVPGGWEVYEARLLEDFTTLIGAFCLEPLFQELLIDIDDIEQHTLRYYYDRQYKSNMVTFKREWKRYLTAEKELQKNRGEDSLYKQFILKYKGDGDAFLRYYADKVEILFQDDLEFLSNYLENYNKAPLEVRDRILEKVDRVSNEHKELRDVTIRKLLGAYTSEEGAVRISRMGNYCLDLNYFCNLSRELQEELAESMPPVKENLKYILDTVTREYDHEKKAKLILKMASKINQGKKRPEEGRILTDAASKLDNHVFITLCLADWFGQKGLLEQCKKTEISDADILSYFTPDFLVTDEKGALRTDYFLFATGLEPEKKGLSGKALLEQYQKDAIIHFYEKDGEFCCQKSEKELLSNDLLKRIAGLAMEGRQEESQRKKQEMQEAIDIRNFEQQNKAFAKGYRGLCKELQEEKILFTDSFKVNINYLFNLSEEGVQVGFKVGNTRDYIVKDGNGFLQAFRDGSTVKYGKDLVLTHDIENLKEEDRAVIRLLSPLRFRVIGSGAVAKRYLPLTEQMLSNIVDLLKGRTVWVGEKKTLVRLDQTDVKLKIDKNYELSVDYDPCTQIIIPAGPRSFLYTSDPNGEAVIDSINANSDQLRLLEFVMENSGISIRPILNDFKRNIYSRLYDSFELAEEIKKDFVLSVIRINAYYDYEDKAITMKTEYLKDERKISRDALTERMDVTKAESFETAMAGLGFEDGVLRDEGGILNFLKMDFSILKRQASIYLSEGLKAKKLVSLNRQVVRISCSKSGIIDAMLEKSDFSEEELSQILQAMKKKKKYVLLSGDRIIDLDSQEAHEFRDTVKDLGLEAGKLHKKKRLNMVEALKAFAHENSCSIDKHLRLMIDEIRSFKDYEAKIPKLSYEMRGYQEDGYRWLSVLSKYNLGGILADDMGLGKTLQIIALIKADTTKKPSLIVCPKSLVFNWINEFSRFDGETSVTEVYGLPEKREELIKGIDYEGKTVYVTSYDSLRNDIELYEGTFHYCILDEAQYIKNVTAQKSKSVKEIKADHRFALTGTPIENNIIELWSIFDFIMPGYFEELSEFKSSAGQETFQEQVAKRIGPFVLRRIKGNVLADLPDKYETILSCEMTGSQKKMYEAVRKKARDAMAAEGRAFDLLPMLTQMRQMCVDPAMCVDDYSGGSGKMSMLEELIPNYLAQGHRILLFSQFVKGLSRVENLLEKHGIGYYLLTGDTPAKERSRMIDEFNSTNGTDVFLISLKAGGTGLNLTGADTVIHLDPWWNVAAENQATDRAHRIGQVRNVEVIKLISENSIEQRVIELQNLKKDLIDRVISNDETSVTGARLEDIAYILD